ncbi:MAG: aromatic ring-hydroxylating dioxygenase subunit alpha [Rhodospirillaceae bacterium]|nr:MAG: aromatic ring-hydroxylating dioxygenase subunit alpha [Rhodospirillaceae bacterium]
MQSHNSTSADHLPFQPAAVQNVLRPIDVASGLPNEAYASADFARYERDEVLAKTWTCIGFGKDIPNAGDAKPVSFMGFPLLMVRRRDNSIAVFHNVCSHRGAVILDEPRNVQNSLRCPYHSWIYDLEGKLTATPNIGGTKQHSCEGFDKSKHGLKEVRSVLFWDMIFINLSGDAVSFDEFSAKIRERWKDFDMSLIRHAGPDSSLKLTVNCNWKLAVENYCEAYHLPVVHPGLNSYSKLEDHYNINEDGAFAGQGSTAYTPLLVENGPDLPHFPNLPAKWAKASEYAALFPNVLLGIHQDHYFAILLEAVDVDRTVEHLEIYYVGDDAMSDVYAKTRSANLATWKVVFAEDVDVVQRMQRGRQSPGFAGGVFSPRMDPPTHCFHRWLAGKLVPAPQPVTGLAAE